MALSERILWDEVGSPGGRMSPERIRFNVAAVRRFKLGDAYFHFALRYVSQCEVWIGRFENPAEQGMSRPAHRLGNGSYEIHARRWIQEHGLIQKGCSGRPFTLREHPDDPAILIMTLGEDG